MKNLNFFLIGIIFSFAMSFVACESNQEEEDNRTVEECIKDVMEGVGFKSVKVIYKDEVLSHRVFYYDSDTRYGEAIVSECGEDIQYTIQYKFATERTSTEDMCMLEKVQAQLNNYNYASVEEEYRSKRIYKLGTNYIYLKEPLIGVGVCDMILGDQLDGLRCTCTIETSSTIEGIKVIIDDDLDGL